VGEGVQSKGKVCIGPEKKEGSEGKKPVENVRGNDLDGERKKTLHKARKEDEDQSRKEVKGKKRLAACRGKETEKGRRSANRLKKEDLARRK